MIRTEGTERARCPRGLVSKIFLRIGSARFAERARRCSGLWPGPGLWRLKQGRVENLRPGKRPARRVEIT